MEPNINLPPFYIGQKVEYITGIKMPKGTVCQVKNVIKMQCGCYVIDIDDKPFFNERPQGNIWECDDCGNSFKGENKIRSGWKCSSFRPIQEQTFPLLTYKKVLEKELVSAN